MTLSTSDSLVNSLTESGFGYLRSKTMVAKFPALAERAIALRDAVNAAGFQFRVFQAGGQYYTRLRLVVITGEKPNRYTDSRHFEGPMEEVGVGSLGMTRAQAASIDQAISDLHADMHRVDALSQAAKLDASLAPAPAPRAACSNRRRL